MRISGEILPEAERHITLKGGGQWNVFPCLFTQATSVTDALADYYDNATVGDVIKSKTKFAYFSENQRWEGNLTAIRPGEGYLFRRLGAGDVNVNFYTQDAANAPRLNQRSHVSYHATELQEFSNADAATNMTIIARIKGETAAKEKIYVYAGSELAEIAEPVTLNGEQQTYYFLTIQSNMIGSELRFITEGGTRLIVEPVNQAVGKSAIAYQPNSHHGTLEAPVSLVDNGESIGTYKILENNHVIIIRGNERYDVTGRKLK